MGFVERIVEHAANDGADADLLERFRALATVLAPFVPESDDVKYAAFYIKEDGEASLVVQSLATDRRVTFDCYPTTSSYMQHSTLLVTTIDENMKRIRGTCRLDDHKSLVAHVRWCVETSDGTDRKRDG